MKTNCAAAEQKATGQAMYNEAAAQRKHEAEVPKEPPLRVYAEAPPPGAGMPLIFAFSSKPWRRRTNGRARSSKQAQRPLEVSP